MILVTCLCCIFESTSAIFVWRALRNFATDMANVENVEEMVGTREAKAAAVATESDGAVATESGGRWRQSPAGRRQPATRRYRFLVRHNYLQDWCTLL